MVKKELVNGTFVPFEGVSRMVGSVAFILQPEFEAKVTSRRGHGRREIGGAWTLLGYFGGDPPACLTGHHMRQLLR